MVALFVWTINDAVNALVLLIALIFVLLGLSLYAWVKLVEWIERLKRRIKR